MKKLTIKKITKSILDIAKDIVCSRVAEGDQAIASNDADAYRDMLEVVATVNTKIEEIKDVISEYERALKALEDN